MENNIELLMNMFDNGCDAVLITDADWNILEEKYSVSFHGKLPELLHVSENCWKNIESEIYLNRRFYQYKLYCSEQNQCRVIVLKELHENPETQDSAVRTACQSLYHVKQQLKTYISENPDFSQQKMLHTLDRISLLIYRKPYLHSIIKNVRNHTIVRYPLQLLKVSQYLKEKLSELLKNYAEISLDLPETEIPFYENIDFFSTVLLSGMVLCHHERGYFHHIQISLSVCDDTAFIRMILKPNFHKTVDMSAQVEAFSFGTHAEEKELLNLFCMLHQGEWSVSPPETSPSSFQLQFRTTEQRQITRFYSTDKIRKSDFDNTFELMLAPVYLSFLK